MVLMHVRGPALAFVLAGVVAASEADAGCRCRLGLGFGAAVGGPAAWGAAPVGAAPFGAAPFGPAGAGSSAGFPPPVPPAYGIPPRPPVLPPPGTLGMTYRQPSQPIPKDRHPRTGMIEVHGVPHDAEVVIEGLADFDGYRDDDGVWHFETRTPLLPELPHIYEVKATSPFTGADDVRTVRLIPGRIVELQY